MNTKNIFNKVAHLDDFMSTTNSPINTHIVTLGDDIYHDHSFFEIVYVINGNIRHIVNGYDMNLEMGDLLFLRPSDKHIYLRENGNTFSHRDITINTKFFCKVCNFFGENFYDEYLKHFIPVKLSLPLADIETLENDINHYISISSSKLDIKLTAAKFFLSKLLSIYYLYLIGSSDEKKPDWLNRLIEKMNMYEYLKAGLPTILSFFNYDRSYMCRVFKQYTGKTMTEYLNDLKLQYTATQLKMTNRTILSICQDIGFFSISHLNKLFKKKYGVTPKEFRNQKHHV